MRRKNLRQVFIIAIPVIVFAAYLASCKKPAANPGTTTTGGPQSGLFIIHASAGTPPVDVYANNVEINTEPFGYTDNSEGYLSFNSNNYIFNFNQSGTQTSLISQTDSLGVYKTYSLILCDSLSNLKLMYMKDQFGNASSDSSNMRFLDLCPNLTSMDVYLDTVQIYTHRTFADNLQNIALDTFMQATPESHTMTLRFPYNGDTVIYQTTVSLYQGKIYTVYVSGFAGRQDSLGLQVNIAENY